MSARDLVERYGSPVYSYDLAAVRAAHADLVAQLPSPSDLMYSVKANPHPSLVTELHRLGCHAEVSSVGELQAALGAGLPPAQILHNGPAKTRTEIEYALSAGVRRFSVDSAAQLHRLGHLAGEHDTSVEALLRVNGSEAPTAAGLTMTGTASQFGIDASTLIETGGQLRHPHVQVRGFHFYLATNVASEEQLIASFRTAVELAATLRPVLDGPLEVLDLGGGFAAPYARSGERSRYPGLRAALTEMLDRLGPCPPRVLFESGRYLTAECGRLAATVQDVKRSKGRTFVLLDSGINHLGGMAGLRRVPPLMPELDAGDNADRPGVTCDVVGPLCTPLDAWSRQITLPGVGIGDVVEVPNVGAYGLTGSLLGFLSHEPPVEVVLDAGEPVHVSRLNLVRTEQKGIPS